MRGVGFRVQHLDRNCEGGVERATEPNISHVVEGEGDRVRAVALSAREVCEAPKKQVDVNERPHAAHALRARIAPCTYT